MQKKATVIAVVNQKGGTGKTTTCENVGVGRGFGGRTGSSGRYRSAGVLNCQFGKSLSR